MLTHPPVVVAGSPRSKHATNFKHGLASGENLTTYRTCQAILRSWRVVVCEQWQTPAAFTRGVIDEVGVRPPPFTDELGGWRWCLRAWEDFGYLLDGGQPFSPDLSFATDDTPAWDIPEGPEFKPGHVQWCVDLYRPARRRSPVPEFLRRSEWSEMDVRDWRPAKSAARQRRREAAREVEREFLRGVQL